MKTEKIKVGILQIIRKSKWVFFKLSQLTANAPKSSPASAQPAGNKGNNSLADSGNKGYFS